MSPPSPSPTDTEDVDADAQVQEMMGFASFGKQKSEPAAPSSSTFPSQNHIAKRTEFGGDNTSDLPAKPIFAQFASSAVTASLPDNINLTASTGDGSPNSSNAYSQTVYTNPVTGISFTRQELFESGQGRKTNAKGDVMFFRPSFLDEDPWKALRRKE